MRYYLIKIVDPATGRVIAPAPTTRQLLPQVGAAYTYSSYVNGRTLPGALNVELDLATVPFSVPVGGAFVRVWGISLPEIAQASNLNNKLISVYGGMQKGLPLATASVNQSGLLTQGYIQQAFGNWVGTDMTLDLLIAANIGQVLPLTTATLGPNTTAPASYDGAKNIVLSWKKGTLLADALRQSLTTAFPAPDYLPPVINIDPNLVAAEDVTGMYSSLVQLAQYVKQASQAIIRGTYTGVEILLKQNQFVVFDGTTRGTPTQIKFQDLIGQPTWIESPLIQFKTVMRADIQVNDYVELPPGLVTTTSQSFSQFKSRSAFLGIFRVQRVRHNGNYRQPNAESWNTTFDAYPV